MTDHADHPLASCFPMMGEDELLELAEDIAKNGLLEPVTLYESKILDGRNRYRACKLKGIDPDYLTYLGNDPASFVISRNVHRRHLTTSQRAISAANVAKLSGMSQEKAASQLNVSPRSVADAKTVIEDGVPELAAAVSAGEVSVSAAATVATLPEEEQREAVATGSVAEKAKKVRESERKPVVKESLTTDAEPVAEEDERGHDPRTLPPVIVPINPDAEGVTSCEAGGGHPFLDLLTEIRSLSARITRDIKRDGEDFLRLYQYLTWCGLLDHDPAKGGQAFFLPLRGVSKIVELAGGGGKMKTEAFIRNAYLVACGGKQAWIPPQTQRRRDSKGGK